MSKRVGRSVWNQQFIQIRRTSKINAFKNKQKPVKLSSGFRMQPIKQFIHMAMMSMIWTP